MFHLQRLLLLLLGKLWQFFFNFRIPQGSAATLLRCGRSLYRRYMESLLVNLPVNVVTLKVTLKVTTLKVVTKSFVCPVFYWDTV